MAAALARKKAAKSRKPGAPLWNDGWSVAGRMATLAFLSLVITGFVVLPAIFDPAELSRPATYAVQDYEDHAVSSGHPTHQA